MHSCENCPRRNARLGDVYLHGQDGHADAEQNDRPRDVQPAEVDAQDVPFEGEELLVFAMALNQDTREEESQQRGDPTELALVHFARKHDAHQEKWLDQNPRVEEIPFDSQRKMMTTVHIIEGEQHLAITKGAVESILEICPAADRDAIQKKAHELAGRANASSRIRIAPIAVSHLAMLTIGKRSSDSSALSA